MTDLEADGSVESIENERDDTNDQRDHDKSDRGCREAEKTRNEEEHLYVKRLGIEGVKGKDITSVETFALKRVRFRELK